MVYRVSLESIGWTYGVFVGIGYCASELGVSTDYESVPINELMAS